jgi:uncharacterized caspase-like protein
MTRRPAAWAALLLFGLALAPVLGQPADGKRYAVLVGVRQYQHDKLPELKYSENDVVELAQVLRGAGYDVTLLCDGEGKKDAARAPSKANIERALKAVLAKCKRVDTVLVAFAGHGLQFEGLKDAFFYPQDVRPFPNRADALRSPRYSRL